MSENDNEWTVNPEINFEEGAKEFLFNLMKEEFSEEEDPILENLDDWVKNIPFEHPGIYPHLGKPYTHYKPEPKFEHYYMVLENLYDYTLKPFDPCIYYDLKPNQRPITSIYLKAALEELRWRDKNAWIEAHLHLIRRFLDSKLDEKEGYVAPTEEELKKIRLGEEDHKNHLGTKYQIMSYFNEYGKNFFYEIFSKTELKDFFIRFDDLDTLINDAKQCHLIPTTVSKLFDIKEQKDEAFLEWVSLYVTRDYIPQELQEFESCVRTLCNMILLMNYFSKGILQQLYLEPSEKELFSTLYIAIDKHSNGLDQEFVKLIKNACLERMYKLRNKIFATLVESPSLIDFIHYETYQIRQKFKNSQYPQLTTEYVLFNWNNVGFASLNDKEYYEDIIHKPFKDKVKKQKKFYDEIRTRVFRSAKDYYFFKARVNFDITQNYWYDTPADQKPENIEIVDPPFGGGKTIYSVSWGVFTLISPKT